MNVLVFHESPIMRKGIIYMLSQFQKDIIFYEASRQDDIIKLSNTKDLDIAFLEFSIKNDEILMIKQLRENTNSIKILLMLNHLSSMQFDMIKSFNIDGVISENAPSEGFTYALRTVMMGKKYYDPILINDALNLNSPISKLSSREKEILLGIARGLSNKEIARDLFISEYTVKKYVSQILQKLQLQDRTQVAIFVHKECIVNNS